MLRQPLHVDVVDSRNVLLPIVLHPAVSVVKMRRKGIRLEARIVVLVVEAAAVGSRTTRSLPRRRSRNPKRYTCNKNYNYQPVRVLTSKLQSLAKLSKTRK